MPNDHRLYFIRILQAAFEQADRTQAVKTAIEEITSLGRVPEYREGFQNFQSLIGALDHQAALDKDIQRLEQLARDRQTFEAQLADAERQTAEHQRLHQQTQGELEQVRSAHREMERNTALLRERAATHEQEVQTLRETARTLKLRLESARKLLQQAASAMGGVNEATDAELVDVPSPGTAKDGPPPLASPAGGGIKPGMSLADLEAQAQRELRQLGGKGAALFKGRGAKG